MAKVIEDTIIIRFSKLVSNDAAPVETIISDDDLDQIQQLVDTVMDVDGETRIIEVELGE